MSHPSLGLPPRDLAAGFPDTRTAALLVGDEGALDALARELNELRELV